MRTLPYTEYRDLTGGMDDKSDNTEMSPTRFQLIENLYVLNDSLIKRPGYKNQFSAALSSTLIQTMRQYNPTNSVEIGLLSASGGALFYDDSAVAGTYTLSPGDGVVVSMEDFDDQVVITDGVNPLVYWPNNKDVATGEAAPIVSNSMPTRAGCIGEFRNRLFMGDLTDVDGKEYPARVMSTEIGRIDTGSPDSNNDLNRSQKTVAMVRHGGGFLIFQTRSTWIVKYSPDFQNLNPDPFIYNELSSSVGTYNQNTVITTLENGTFFVSRRGVYWIPPGEPQPPIYISSTIEDFWSKVNHNYLGASSFVEVPEMNGVILNIPYQESQKNNRAIFINYQNIEELGRNVISPAYSLFKGEITKEFSFRSGARLVKDGRERTVLGGYDGIVYLFGDVTSDAETGIAWRFRSPAYGPGGRGREKLWHNFALDVDYDTTYDLTVTIRQYDNSPYTKALAGSGGSQSGAYLGPTGRGGSIWTLGSSYLTISAIGTVSGDLKNRSRFIELDAAAGASTKAFALHGILLYYKTANNWAL